MDIIYKNILYIYFIYNIKYIIYSCLLNPFLKQTLNQINHENEAHQPTFNLCSQWH